MDVHLFNVLASDKFRRFKVSVNLVRIAPIRIQQTRSLHNMHHNFEHNRYAKALSIIPAQ